MPIILVIYATVLQPTLTLLIEEHKHFILALLMLIMELLMGMMNLGIVRAPLRAMKRLFHLDMLYKLGTQTFMLVLM